MTAAERLHSLVLNSAGAPQGGVCTAAFSGGADSTALLCCLYDLRSSLGITLRAVHVHHGIRGAEADRDAAFCAALCERLGIPLQTVYVDVPRYAAEHRLSYETAARMLRYEALRQAAPEGTIATAHHADDNAETVLFHLLRGSGTRGLCGIPPRSPDGRIIRPLLDAEKADILRYLQEIGQDFVEDGTNADDSASRNRIRHRLLPLLKTENPAALRHISRCAALLSADDALLSLQADAAYDACRDAAGGGMHGLAAYPQPIRMRVFRRLIAETELLHGARHIDPSFENLSAADALLNTGCGRISLSRDVYAEAYAGILYIRREAVLHESLPLQTGPNRLFADRLCMAEISETAALSRNIHKSDTKSTLDFDMIIGRPYFRVIRGADRIRLPGRDFRTALKKQVQRCVPPPERRSLYALFDECGCIFCERVGIAQRVKPHAETRRLLTLSAFAVLSEETKDTSGKGVSDTWEKIADY
ncbi:MAG: tRNA lysidine(34) synthetase TilS [Oscillospiraceae bacterium]|nr:tRNA lysidine(34) synthetase TilS [Oscillospiraceae bacterium]